MKISKKQNIEKILLIRLSSMGDVILTTALVRCLRKSFPTARIDFAVASQFAGAIEHNPYIDNVIRYDKSLPLSRIGRMKQELLSELGGPYDAILDLQRNRRSMHFRAGLGKIVYKIRKQRLKKISLVHFKFIKQKPSAPIPEIYFETARRIGVADDGGALEIWTANEQENGKLQAHINSRQIETIGIAPGAHHFTKRLPAETFANTIKLLHEKYGCSFVLLGGPKDSEICASIASTCQAPIEDRSGATTIEETVLALGSCDALITNDTGVMHIAAARGVPVVAIFGSTVTDFGFAPYRSAHRIVQVALRCRPCTHIGRAACPKKHFDCMMRISPQMIIDAVDDLLNDSKS